LAVRATTGTIVLRTDARALGKKMAKRVDWYYHRKG
jgi:hypothetical protein